MDKEILTFVNIENAKKYYHIKTPIFLGDTDIEQVFVW